MHYSIDRFEGDTAVLEDDQGGIINAHRSLLPAGSAPGDVLSETGGVFSPDPEETAKRREYVLSLQNRLRGKKR